MSIENYESLYSEMVMEPRLSKKELAQKEFEKSLDPNMDPVERMLSVYRYMNQRDEDTIKALDPERPDGEERRNAFLESLLVAIETDTEDWGRKSVDIINALLSNSAERMLISLCGWGANSIAKRAMIIPDDGLTFPYDIDSDATLIVKWSNGKTSSSECYINQCIFEIEDFDAKIFREYEDTAEIEEVLVQVIPADCENTYCFACVTKEEKERTNDDFCYWYVLYDEEDEQ